jgi:hypothetical protein
VTDSRQVWKFSVIIEASREEAERVSEAIVAALCPDGPHPGPCAVPWTIIQSGFEDLDEEERRGWEEDFEEEREQWRDHRVD